MMSTALAGVLTWCCSCAVSVACATYPKGVWNFFVDGFPVLLNRLFDLPQLEVAPESPTMYGTNPLRVFSLVSCSSWSFFFLLHIVVFLLVLCVNVTVFWFSTSTATYLVSRIIHAVISVWCFYLAVKLLLPSLFPLYFLDPFPHHSWFLTFLDLSGLKWVLYHGGQFCFFFSKV